VAHFATSANPAYSLLHRAATVALGHRYILSHASITKIQEKKKAACDH